MVILPVEIVKKLWVLQVQLFIYTNLRVLVIDIKKFFHGLMKLLLMQLKILKTEQIKSLNKCLNINTDVDRGYI